MKTDLDAFSLQDFLNQSPCNFLAVDTIRKNLESNGFTELRQADKWSLKVGGKYFVTKNSSAIFAFVVGSRPIDESGFNIISAHSDSPCFRIKPNPEMVADGVLRLNTEVYGGPILYTWFDRPLSLTGRVLLHNPENPTSPIERLIDFEEPVMVIPHLAIHFNRGVNEGNPLSKQKDMLPVAAIVNDMAEKDNYLLKRIQRHLQLDNINDIIDFDLFLYNCQKAQLVGFNKEFICSGRIDDLGMAHAAMCALLSSDNPQVTKIMAIFDNEETGSGTKQGAASPVLANILRRISTAFAIDEEGFFRALAKSFMISADNAHAAHPNYPEKYDPTNHPKMGSGPAIKINANCKYMTDAHSSAVFIELCRKANVEYQYFVNRSDVAGGSTLGNILTSQIDIDGVDMGNPIWAMHSASETASIKDQQAAIDVFTVFYNTALNGI